MAFALNILIGNLAFKHPLTSNDTEMSMGSSEPAAVIWYIEVHEPVLLLHQVCRGVKRLPTSIFVQGVKLLCLFNKSTLVDRGHIQSLTKVVKRLLVGLRFGCLVGGDIEANGAIGVAAVDAVNVSGVIVSDVAADTAYAAVARSHLFLKTI